MSVASVSYLRNMRERGVHDEGIYMSRSRNSELVKKGFDVSTTIIRAKNVRDFIASVVSIVDMGLHGWSMGEFWHFSFQEDSFMFSHKTKQLQLACFFLKSSYECFVDPKYVKALAQYITTAIVQFIVDNDAAHSHGDKDFGEDTIQTLVAAIKLLRIRIEHPSQSNIAWMRDIELYFARFVLEISFFKASTHFACKLLHRSTEKTIEISRGGKTYIITTDMMDVDDARIISSCVLAAIFDTTTVHNMTLLDHLPELVDSYMRYRRQRHVPRSQVTHKHTISHSISTKPSHYTSLATSTRELISSLTREVKQNESKKASVKLHTFDLSRIAISSLEGYLLENVAHNRLIDDNHIVLIVISSIDEDVSEIVNVFLEKQKDRCFRTMVLHLTKDPTRVIWNAKEHDGTSEIVNVVGITKVGDLDLVDGVTSFFGVARDSFKCSADFNSLHTRSYKDRSISYKVMTYELSKKSSWWETLYHRSGFGCMCSRSSVSWFSCTINTLLHTKYLASLLRHLSNSKLPQVVTTNTIRSLPTTDLDVESCNVIVNQLLIRGDTGYYEGTTDHDSDLTSQHMDERAYHVANMFMRSTCILGLHYNILNTSEKYTRDLVNDITSPVHWTSHKYLESWKDGGDMSSHIAWHDHPHPLIIIMRVTADVIRHPPNKIMVNHMVYTRRSACILVKGPKDIFCSSQSNKSGQSPPSSQIVAGITNPREAVLDCSAVMQSGEQEWELKGQHDRALFTEKRKHASTNKTSMLRGYSIAKDFEVYQKVNRFSFMLYILDALGT